MNEIVIALISGLSVAIPSVIASIASGKRNNILIQFKIEELTKKVEKHNQVVERVFMLERENAVQNEKIKEIEKDIGK